MIGASLTLMSLKNNLGYKYRLIRKSKQISLKSAAHDITSVSHLSDWENGKTLMDIELVLQLLERINIEPYDFFDQNGVSKLLFYTEDVIQMYAENDIQGLKEMFNIIKTNYELNPQDKKLFFKMSIVANFYMDLTERNLLSNKDIAILQLRFSNLDSWYIEDIVLFGNIQLLLPSSSIYRTTRSLISCSIENDGINNKMVLNTIINAIFVLLKKQEPILASKILTILKHQSIFEKHASEIIRIEFMEKLIKFINSGNQEEIEMFLKTLEALKLNNTVRDFKFAFSQIKDIYTP